MVYKKFLTYKVQGLMSGAERDSVSLELKCASNTSNYLIHRALTQELTNKRSFTASTKPEVKFVVEEENLGNKKEQVVPVRVQSAHLYGEVVVLFLVQSQSKSNLNLIEKRKT